VKVFLDTNILVSAFATRGLCADVLRHVLAEHELVTAEVVLTELRRVLRMRFRMPPKVIAEIEALLREHEVIARPSKPPKVEVRDPDDVWVLASAISGKADVLVTNDRDLLDVAAKSPIDIVDARGFWALMRKE